MLSRAVWGLFALGMIVRVGQAQAAGQTCEHAKCPRGTKVYLDVRIGDPFYACGTAAIARYANTLLGLVDIQKTIGGKMPRYSRETGEPIFEGETKNLIDDLRGAAGVRSFDQAAAQCEFGSPTPDLVVIEVGAGDYIWLKSKDRSFWVPSYAAKRRD